MLRRMLSPRVLVPRVLILGALAICGSVLRADVIYSNFVTGPPQFSTEGILPVTDNSFDYSVAEEFMPSGNYDLSGIQFVVGTTDNPDSVPDHTITLGVYADDGGTPSATALETLTYNGVVVQQNADTIPILSVTSVSNPELLAGNNYWLIMDGPAADSLVWFQNLAGDANILKTAGTTDGSHVGFGLNEATDGVFEIDGTLVSDGPSSAPEPGSWLLMIAGMGTMAFLRQARR
jgi:hypothetical protein